MSIIISQAGKNAQKIDKSDFEKEDYLQNYIHENPESIPVYEIAEDKRLFVVAREFSTESGPIDALAVDKDGDLYVVETKLYKNPDKRTVVAQALDYGASLWKHLGDFSEFLDVLNEEVQDKFQMSFSEKVKEFFKLEDEQVSLMLDSMKNNLRNGNLKFVILMDSMDERLRDLIIYVNQNSQFDIFAVELEYYKFKDYEIVIPKIFGVEVRKSVGSHSASNIDWTPEKFLADARSKIQDDKTYNILAALYDFTKSNADVLDFGRGSESGSMTFKFKDDRAASGLVSIFTIWTGGSIRFRFANIKKRIGEENVKLYFNKLKGILPSQLWTEDALGGNGPAFSLNEIFKDEKTVKRFKTAVLEFIKEAKK